MNFDLVLISKFQLILLKLKINSGDFPFQSNSNRGSHLIHPVLPTLPTGRQMKVKTCYLFAVKISVSGITWTSILNPCLTSFLKLRNSVQTQERRWEHC